MSRAELSNSLDGSCLKIGLFFHSQVLATKPELKKWMKKTMPFVQFVKTRMEELGVAALDLKTDFDEAKVLKDNLDYIVNTLGLEDVDIRFSDEATEKIQEECRPGKLASSPRSFRGVFVFLGLFLFNHGHF